MEELEILRAPVTNALIVLNLVISGYAFFMDNSALSRYAFHVGAVLSGKQYYRLLSGSFLHVNPIHFLFNMFTLFSFGRIMEPFIGSLKFLVLYLGAMLIADIVALYAQRNNPDYTSVGASGAVTGVVFSFCFIDPTAQLSMIFIPGAIPAFLFAVIYVAYSMFAMSNSGFRGGIAHEAHLGGALGGVLLTVLLVPGALENFMRTMT